MWEGKYYDATVSDDKKIEFIRERYGEHTEAMLKLFKRHTLAKIYWISDISIPNSGRTSSVYRQRAAVSSAPTYAYMLAYDFSLNGGTPAYHSCEHSLVFRSTDCMAIMQEPCIEQLCNEISMSWCSFAYNGTRITDICRALADLRGRDRNTYVFDKRSRCATSSTRYVRLYGEKLPDTRGPFD